MRLPLPVFIYSVSFCTKAVSMPKGEFCRLFMTNVSIRLLKVNILSILALVWAIIRLSSVVLWLKIVSMLLMVWLRIMLSRLLLSSSRLSMLAATVASTSGSTA